MLRIGIVGFGFMGRAHWEAYGTLPDAQVTAIATRRPESVGNEFGAWSNIKGVAQSKVSVGGTKILTDYRVLLAMPDVDIVDVCLPTFLHAEVAVAALEAGKHVVCEKPLGLTVAEARLIAEAAAKARTLFMPAMCIRFWPEWAWLKDAVVSARYGRTLSAIFRRVSAPPSKAWFLDERLSGGALLDLHIHDTDFVLHLFGMPKAVCSWGYGVVKGRIDHVVTHYLFDGVPLVVAEGGWFLDKGLGFSMRYTVKFEQATADYDFARTPPLLLAREGKAEPVVCDNRNGYQAELAYFLECVRSERRPAIVTAEDAVTGMRIIDAERCSIERGGNPVECGKK